MIDFARDYDPQDFHTDPVKAAEKLDTERKWLMTGTPIQNNLKELWSLLLWLKMKPYCDGTHSSL